MADNPSFVLQKINTVKFEDRPVPELKSEKDVLVAIKQTGICGSDVHYYTHGAIGSFIVKAPMVLGHESAGEIVKVGAAVKSLKIGDRVALEPGVPCYFCKQCKAGRYNLCPEMAFAATPPFDGTLARYYVLPEDMCVLLPDHVSLEEGALIEPLSVGVHSVRRAGVSAGQSVVVFGAGPAGLLIGAVAKAFGASTIVAVDIQQDRLDLAKRVAATHTFIPSRSDSADVSASKIIALLGGNPPDVAIDASGVEPSIKTAIAVLKQGGTYVQVGMGAPQISFPITDFTVKEILASGSFRYGPGDYELAVKLVATGLVNVKDLITHRVKFTDAEKAFKLVMDPSAGAVKVLIAGPE
ncbi:chaperonin 10-like protein [Lipomyces oligophaga]|uniref:chaperonin 10-like protein n=1 Tax=Lipomyces oligophaga TaxID=45792 RepID=UPI0034CDCB40